MHLLQNLMRNPRKHPVAYRVAGALTGLITSLVFTLGYFTRGDEPPMRRGFGWFTRPLVDFLHDGNNWHMLAASFSLGITFAASLTVLGVQLLQSRAARVRVRAIRRQFQ